MNSFKQEKKHSDFPRILQQKISISFFHTLVCIVVA